MKRQIFLWVGCGALLSVFLFGQEAFADATYRVRPGDTLARIAKNHGVSPSALRAANHLKSNLLKPAQILVIPKSNNRIASKPLAKKAKAVPCATIRAATDPASHTVKRGDTITRIAKKYGMSVAELRALNRLGKKPLRPGQVLVLSRPAPVVVAKATPNPAPGYEGEDPEDIDEIIGEDDIAAIEREKREQGTGLQGNWNGPDEQKLFVRVVRGFLGAPYQFGGSSVRGIDCSAFVRKIYQFFEVSLPRTAHEQSRMGQAVDRNDLVEGDLVFFHTKRPIGHVGIYIGNNEFIHASYRKRQVRIDSLDAAYYSKRFVKAVRLKGADDNL